MLRAAALLSLFLLFAACISSSQEGSPSFDSREDYRQALSNGKPTVVEFSAVWCGICRRMAPIVEEMNKKYGDRVDIVELNFDREEELVEKYGVRGTPTFLFFNSSGEVEKVAVGYIPEEKLEEEFLRLRQSSSG